MMGFYLIKNNRMLAFETDIPEHVMCFLNKKKSGIRRLAKGQRNSLPHH